MKSKPGFTITLAVPHATLLLSKERVSVFARTEAQWSHSHSSDTVAQNAVGSPSILFMCTCTRPWKLLHCPPWEGDGEAKEA